MLKEEVRKAFYTISMYLYNTNILEYTEIVVTDANSRILDIEDCSIIYDVFYGHSLHNR